MPGAAMPGSHFVTWNRRCRRARWLSPRRAAFAPCCRPLLSTLSPLLLTFALYQPPHDRHTEV
jgi:hypothetical protein